jgi:hypothetical protein
MSKNSISIFLSSRNNYRLLPLFLKNTDIQNYNLINIDDCSSNKEIKLGKKICSENNIQFINNLDRGLQWAWHTAIENIDPEIKFVIWCTHDTYPITNNFFSKLDNIVSNGKLDNFGVVGFNYFGPMVNSTDPSLIQKNTCGILAKAPLMKLPGRGGWYRSGDMDLPWDIYGKPFAVESPADFGWMINVNLFKKYISPSNKYHLFGACEDLSMQFLNNNIYNIVLPNFVAWHNQEIKSAMGIPTNSANILTKLGFGKKYFGNYKPYLNYWKEKWSWDRQDRTSFEEVKGKYKGTLIYEFYHHDYRKGPLKTFDI